MEEKDKIQYLESLRGLAALAVAIFHFKVGSTFNNTFTNNAWLMVDFFFVLSGFVIALNYQHRISTVLDIYNFQARRFLRLYPLHFLTLVLWLGWVLIEYAKESYTGDLDGVSAFGGSDNAVSFVTNLLLIHNLLGDSASWNFPSWSISAEFYTYLVFAGLVFACRRNGALFVILSLAVSLSAFLYLYNHTMTSDLGFVRCLYSFFLGVIAFNIRQRGRATVPNWVSYLLIVVSVYLVCVAGPQDEIGLNIFIPFVFCGLILSLTLSFGANPLKTMLEQRFLVYLGTISYGIYMIHALVWAVAFQVLKLGLHYPTFVTEEGKTRLLIENQWVADLFMVLGLALVIGLAHLSYRFVEMPVNAFRHRLGKFDGPQA